VNEVNAHNQYSVVSNFIAGEEIRNLFLGVHLSNSRNRFGRFDYKSNESTLSELCSVGIYSLSHKLMFINDRTATSIIKGATYSGVIPFKFKVVEYITWLFVFLPLVIMVLDIFFDWTELSSLFYFYASACGVSLLITAKLAKKEWMVHNWNGKKE